MNAWEDRPEKMGSCKAPTANPCRVGFSGRSSKVFTRIAGRCYCGMVMSWVERNPDEHLACFGIRWCGVCGDAAPYKGKCIPCQRARFAEARRQRLQDDAYRQSIRAYHREYTRRRLRDPQYRARHNEQSRRSNAKSRAKRADPLAQGSVVNVTPLRRKAACVRAPQPVAPQTADVA